MKWLLLLVCIVTCMGCSTVTREQKNRWAETMPICFDKIDCSTKWAAARNWVQGNAGYKIQIYSDDLIETYNSQQYDPKIAVSVSKNPLPFMVDGEQPYGISIRVSCGNIFGCIPTADEAIVGFNNSVAAAESNDPTCYTKMLDDKKPKLGYYPIWSKATSKYIVKRVCAGSPAEKAGIKPNDILVRLGDVDVDREESINNDKRSFGEVHSIEVLRNSSKLNLEAKFPTRDEVVAAIAKPAAANLGAVRSVSIEERLESLTRLLQKGMITQEEFEAKKKQLITDL